MELVLVPATHIDQAWRDGAHKLSEACDRVDEVTADQLKLILARGEQTLVALQDGERFRGWAVINFEQLPNKRVLFIYSLYAPGVTDEFTALLVELAGKSGCSALRASVDNANKRLWERKINVRHVYSVMEYPI